MKIAFINNFTIVTPTNGIKMQAMMWKKGLEERGHEVTLIKPWETNDWREYDYIVIFKYGTALYEYVRTIAPLNPNIVLAPIIDSNYSPRLFRFTCKYLKVDALRLRSNYSDLFKIKDQIKLYLVRSEYEKRFITEGLGIAEEKIRIIPLSSRLPLSESKQPKENFCLHVSILDDERKNVKKLIEAAAKYRFELKLAGYIHEPQKFLKKIASYPNIEYVGFLSDEELCQYYQRSKVFALPSTYEGVGMAALEAASYGCDIVMTNIGAPKEYYKGLAYLVNPNDVDEIGESVLKAMEHSNQPTLQQYIIENFHIKSCMILLEDALKRIQ